MEKIRIHKIHFQSRIKNDFIYWVWETGKRKGKMTEVLSLVDFLFLSRLVGKTPQHFYQCQNCFPGLNNLYRNCQHFCFPSLFFLLHLLTLRKLGSVTHMFSNVLLSIRKKKKKLKRKTATSHSVCYWITGYLICLLNSLWVIFFPFKM